MITADTITDEQIRELQDDPSTDLKVWLLCAVALDENPEANPIKHRAALVKKARARCEELISARVLSKETK